MQQLKYKNAVLLPKQVLSHADDVELVKRVFGHKLLEQTKLRLRELVVDLSVAVDFNGHLFAILVIDCRHNLSKRPLSQNTQHFEAVENVVA